MAELLGSLVFVLVCLHLKNDIYRRGLNPIYYPVGATISQAGLTYMFKSVSGGLFNPAIALSQIIWQNTTYMYEIGADQSYWTPEYATCYILAPFIGAFLAGNVFGYQKRLYLRIEHNLHESESEEETPAQLKSKKTMKLHKLRTL